MTDQHDQFNAWADGELPPDAAARFDREAGLGAAREWLAADVPGIERADQLTAPRLSQIRNPKSAIRNPQSKLRTPHSAFRAWPWQFAAAAAIFFGGFIFGRIGTPQAIPPATPVVQVTPAPAQTPVDHTMQHAQAVPRSVTHQDGRVIIDTVVDSGAHATWVIDGSFKLAFNQTKIH